MRSFSSSSSSSSLAFLLGAASLVCLVACSAADTDAGSSSVRRPRKPSSTGADPGNASASAEDDGADDRPGASTPAPTRDAGNGSSAPGSSTPPSPPSSLDAGTSPIADAGSASANATNGTGGATGFREAKSTGGLSYQMNAPVPTAGKPQGVLVLLHGSTASNYTRFVGIMANVAAQYDLIRVSVLAPNGAGWNEGQQAPAAALLHRFMQEDLYPKYNIDKTKVLFSGQSSGGGFLSSHFVPLHAKDYQGGAFLQCGAAPPAVAFAPDAATKQKFKLHFEITTGDTIWPDSYARAVSAYTTAGMKLSKDNTKPGGHCAFDQQQVIVDHIAAMLAP